MMSTIVTAKRVLKQLIKRTEDEDDETTEEEDTDDDDNDENRTETTNGTATTQTTRTGLTGVATRGGGYALYWAGDDGENNFFVRENDMCILTSVKDECQIDVKLQET